MTYNKIKPEYASRKIGLVKLGTRIRKAVSTLDAIRLSIRVSIRQRKSIFQGNFSSIQIYAVRQER